MSTPPPHTDVAVRLPDEDPAKDPAKDSAKDPAKDAANKPANAAMAGNPWTPSVGRSARTD